MGYLPQELERKSIIKFIHPDDLVKLKQIHYDSRLIKKKKVQIKNLFFKLKFLTEKKDRIKRFTAGDVIMDALFRYELIGRGLFTHGKNRLTLLSENMLF